MWLGADGEKGCLAQDHKMGKMGAPSTYLLQPAWQVASPLPLLLSPAGCLKGSIADQVEEYPVIHDVLQPTMGSPNFLVPLARVGGRPYDHYSNFAVATLGMCVATAA